jgi:hypothetical protein
MDGWLKTLVALACIVIIAGGAYIALGEYQRVTREQANEASAQKQASEKRAFELAADGCRPQIDELLRQHAQRPVKSASDVSPELRRDITICVQRDIAFAFEKNELKRTGLDSAFRN